MQPVLRARERLTYGIGSASEGVKNNSFNIFLLFFYQQVLGLDPALCGLALFVALVVDAITDPLVGLWSDRTRSRFGRRHAFMYCSIVPLAACFYFVFSPPRDLGQTGLFAWLLVFAVGARFSMTLFAIPHQSLVAELTPVDAERIGLQSLRTVAGWVFGLTNTMLAYTVFFAATEAYPQGLLNPDGYPRLALFGATLIVIATAISAVGTQKPALRAEARGIPANHGPVRELPRIMREAFRIRAYQAAVFGGLVLFVGYGLMENLNNYMNTYFWGFTSEQIGVFVAVIFLSAMTVLFSARRLQSRFGKRQVGIASVAVFMVMTPTVIGFRLLGILPANDSSLLLPVLSVVVYFSYAAVIMGMTVVGAMIADATDEFESRTGTRQEGLLYSAGAFLAKAASGLGVLVAGVLVRMSGFTDRLTDGSPDPSAVAQLGAFYAFVTVTFGAATILLFRRYRLEMRPAAGPSFAKELPPAIDQAAP